MSTIVTRSGKGSPLTNNEVDTNFTNLNSDKYQSGDNPTFGILTATGDSAFTSTGAVTVSKGTTAERPATSVKGMLRYNSSTDNFEGYKGTTASWSPIGDVYSFSAGTTGLTPSTFSTGAITLGGTLAPSNGGTGQTSIQAAINALAGATTSGYYLRGNGTNVSMSALQAADVPLLNQNTTGTAANITATSNSTLTTLSSLSLPVGQLSGTLPVTGGGTGATTAATARSNLSAAQSGANTDITSVALTTGTISTAPTSGTDIVNKTYADSIASGVNFHAACYLATAAPLASYTYNNGSSGVGATITGVNYEPLVVDGVTVELGIRILVKDEVSTSAKYNGVYTVTNVGQTSISRWVLTRATDYDTSGTGTNEVDQGDMLLVLYGTVNANTSWVQQTPLPITIGTTSIVFIEFAATQTYTAGAGLSLSTNQFSITNVGTAGTYGSASQVPVLTTNSRGQITGVTNTTIAISGSNVSGNISGSANNVTGTVAIANGGTGATTAQGAIDNIANGIGTQTAGQVFRSNGTSIGLSWIQNSDLPSPLSSSTLGTASNVTGTVTISHGGTGQTTATAAFNALSPIVTTGDLIIGTGSNFASRLGIGPNNYILTSNGTTASWEPNPSGTGSVTSVAATVPSFLSISGSPITTSGTLAISYSGTALPIANGGTGATTLAAANIKTSSYATTVTSGANTTLTSSSATLQYFTGTNTQGVILPSPATTIIDGQSWEIHNKSTQPISVVTATYFDAVGILKPNQVATITYVSSGGTNSTGWYFEITGFTSLNTGSVVSSAYNTTTTSAGTFSLLSSSDRLQYFTDTSTHTVRLPLTTTLILGQTWDITNKSTVSITVTTFGADNNVTTLALGTTAIFT